MGQSFRTIDPDRTALVASFASNNLVIVCSIQLLLTSADMFDRVPYLIFGVPHPADITELILPKSCSITFPNGKDDLMNFEVSIRPDEGYYL